MASYVATVPPRGATDRTVFVRDGFSWPAFILPAFWLLWNRLWVEAAVVFALQLGLGALGEGFGAPGAGITVSLLVSLLVGLEGHNWRLAALRRRGWREAGAIEAHDLDDAETRFFAVDDALAPAAGDPMPRSPRGLTAVPAPLGLLGYRG